MIDKKYSATHQNTETILCIIDYAEPNNDSIDIVLLFKCY